VKRRAGRRAVDHNARLIVDLSALPTPPHPTDRTTRGDSTGSKGSRPGASPGTGPPHPDENLATALCPRGPRVL
jgi:hypothetical protein